MEIKVIETAAAHGGTTLMNMSLDELSALLDGYVGDKTISREFSQTLYRMISHKQQLAPLFESASMPEIILKNIIELDRHLSALRCSRDISCILNTFVFPIVASVREKINLDAGVNEPQRRNRRIGGAETAPEVITVVFGSDLVGTYPAESQKGARQYIGIPWGTSCKVIGLHLNFDPMKYKVAKAESDIDNTLNAQARRSQPEYALRSLIQAKSGVGIDIMFTKNKQQVLSDILGALQSIMTTIYAAVSIVSPPLGPSQGFKVPSAPIMGEVNAESAQMFFINPDLRGTAMLSALKYNGLLYAYFLAQVHGLRSKKVLQKIDEYKNDQRVAAFIRKYSLSLVEKNRKIDLAIKLIVEKFPEYKWAVTRQFESLDAALAILSKSQQKVITDGMQYFDDYIKKFMLNKCPHIRMYHAMRQEPDERKSALLLQDLLKFAAAPANAAAKTTAGQQILCSECGYELLCPHLKTYIEMTAQGKRFAEIKVAMGEYISAIARSERKVHYCKICSEEISSYVELGESGEVSGIKVEMDEEIRKELWSEAGQALRGVKLSSEGTLVNTPRVIIHLVDACYPIIYELNKAIVKSKTSTAEEIKSKRKLYITIYVYAFLINLMNTNREVSFKALNVAQPRGAVPRGQQSSPLLAMFNHAIGVIMTSRNVIIRNIRGMTGEIIKNKLIEAYKILAGNSVSIKEKNHDYDVFFMILLDPVFKFYYETTAIGHRQLEQPINKLLTAAMTKYLGNIDNIKKTYGSGSGVRPQPLYTALSMPNSASQGAEAIIDCLKALWKGIGIVTENLYQTIKIKGEEDNSIYSEAYAKYYGDLEALNDKLIASVKLAREQDRWRIASYDKIVMAFPHVNSRAIVPQVDIRQLYDATGALHKFDIYICDDGAERRAQDFAKAIEAGKPLDVVVVNTKCSGCGVHFNAVNKQDARKTLQMAEDKSTIENFMRYYELRCPLASTAQNNEFHVWQDNKICKQCGGKQNPDSKSEEFGKYFEKYKKKYNEDRNQLHVQEVTVGKKSPANEPQQTFEMPKYNVAVINNIANILKVNPHVLANIGAFEGAEYTFVETGKYIAQDVDKRFHQRIFYVAAKVNEMIAEYNMLKNINKVSKPPAGLSKIIDGANIPRQRLAEVLGGLPAINDDFYAQFSYFMRTNRPRETLQWCLQEFAEKLTVLVGGPAIAKDFAAYYVAKVVNAEYLISRAGYFSWALLYGDRDTETADTNFQIDEDDTDPDRLDEADTEDQAEGDTSAPLKNNFDVEKQPADAEVGDDEDDSNDVHVGDDYGL